jgi:hypothetical protein
MEATFTEGTITSALGISDQWGDAQHHKTIKKLGEVMEVSTVLEELGKEAKVEELGVNSESLTPYEKKLLMAGFFTGSLVAQAVTHKMMVENPMEALLSSLGGMNLEKED